VRNHLLKSFKVFNYHSVHAHTHTHTHTRARARTCNCKMWGQRFN